MLPRTHQCTHSQVLFTLALWPCPTACPTSHLSTDCFPPLPTCLLKVGRENLSHRSNQISEQFAETDGTFFFSNPAFNQAQLILSLLFLMLSQIYPIAFSSVPFSCSFVSDSLRPHGLQHARLHCTSPSPELAQAHVHRVGDTIQQSHPLSSPSPPVFNLSQYQGLFQ